MIFGKWILVLKITILYLLLKLSIGFLEESLLRLKEVYDFRSNLMLHIRNSCGKSIMNRTLRNFALLSL